MFVALQGAFYILRQTNSLSFITSWAGQAPVTKLAPQRDRESEREERKGKESLRGKLMFSVRRPKY